GQLVNDMRAIPWMQDAGKPVIFDGTHSVQQPGGKGDRSGGDRRMVPFLTRAAVAAGGGGGLLATHPPPHPAPSERPHTFTPPDPDHAPSDGPNMLPLDDLPALIRCCLKIRQAIVQ